MGLPFLTLPTALPTGNEPTETSWGDERRGLRRSSSVGLASHVEVLLGDHHGHSVVQGSDNVFCRRGDDREGVDGCAVTRSPYLPKACKGEESALGWMDVVRLFPVLAGLPLEEPAGGNDAAPRFVSGPKRRLLRERLGAEVDEFGGDGLIFGPARNQPPATAVRNASSCFDTDTYCPSPCSSKLSSSCS